MSSPPSPDEQPARKLPAPSEAQLGAQRAAQSAGTPPAPEDELPESLYERSKRLLIGKPRDLADTSLFHKLSLIPLLAWVGLGADGLSSSAYGPEEAFLTLGEHRFLALGLAAMMVLTVTLISLAYTRIIEDFPAGGGGYAVATKLLGAHTGLVSGCALLVDYVLTITVSVAAAGDSLFSFVPLGLHWCKQPFEFALILGLVTLNLRGVRESVLALVPVFVIFLITHVVLIATAGGVGLRGLDQVSGGLAQQFQAGQSSLGLWGLLLVFTHAYSMGAGTYTGIEAVSNGLPLMREPRVKTARRTMLYMAVSLAVTASGLLVCYLLLDVHKQEGKTLNAVLAGQVGQLLGLGAGFAVVTLFAEGMLLVVAAQTGFLGGPRVLANMAVDSWVPRRFAGLSERLTTQNGILLVGGAAVAALFYTGGDVDVLVVMYAINVFVTFSLSMLAMLRFWARQPASLQRRTRLLLFGTSLLLCATILITTVIEKFAQGAWVTLLVTGVCIALCILIHRHYRTTSGKLAELDKILDSVRSSPSASAPPLDPTQPTAAVLVGGYSGMGIHTLLAVIRNFPNYYKNFVFISVGVVDSGSFKGVSEIESLRAKTDSELQRYVDFLRSQGISATYRSSVGTEVATEAEEIARELSREFPRTVFFAGKLVFGRETFFDRILHNETAVALQRRLHFQGKTMVILPVKVS